MSAEFIIIIVVAFVLLSLGFYLFSIFYATKCICNATLRRTDKEKWGRTIPEINERTLQMDKEGLEWQKEHDSYKQEVHIVNNGLNLYGEYYDLGFDKVAMILTGRTDSLRYAYYFARPYSESGFNLLLIDPRAHGLSDGEINTVGFEEGRDAVAWVKFLKENYNVDTVVFHGICIGAAAGMMALTSPDCPDCVKGIVTEGMFVNFAQSMRNHLIERKKLMYPIMQSIDHWFKKHTGHSMYKGPVDVMPRMNKPILMLQSEADPYSTADNARKLFELCPSEDKTLVMCETGDHSMLRITHTEKYDSSIKEYLRRNFSETEVKI